MVPVRHALGALMAEQGAMRPLPDDACPGRLHPVRTATTTM
jgi:hypothetical protein